MLSQRQAKAIDRIDDAQLWEVVDAVLAAMGDRRSRLGLALPFLPLLRGTPDWPSSLDRYDMYVVQQACERLVRMGYLENPGRPWSEPAA